MMKVLTILLLLLGHSLLWAKSQDKSELGRSLANYQACSQVSVVIGDRQMFNYYQKMFNDIGLDLLILNPTLANQAYSAWDKSEKILANISQESLQKICLSRFDELSRKMQKKVLTKK